MPPPSRRAVLGGLGLGALGLPLLAACSHRHIPVAAAPTGLRVTVGAWIAIRGPRYQIAHRGSGDVRPEHSLVAYEYALAAGARALELSVDITSDGVLVCMHDLTYDRTTTGHGAVASQPASVLAGIGIDAPQLGPAWTTPPLTPVPRLADVLDRIGGRAVLCLEAKDDHAYEPMIAMVEQRALQGATIVKAVHTSPRVAQAQQAGYPVFSYLGTGEADAATITAAARVLRPDTDYLGLPATDGDELTYLDDGLVGTAVATGVPVWVYPVHRRSDVAHYQALGVQGALSSSYAYTTSSRATATADDWAGKRVAAGQLSRKPDEPNQAPSWTGSDLLTLDRHNGGQQFLTLGQLAPIAAAAGTYTVEFEARWDVLPVDRTSNLTLAFGHEDDAYYEHKGARGPGYHAILRPDGRLQLYRHRAGHPDGTLLATRNTPALVAGRWLGLRLQVTPSTLSWSRLDGAGTVSARDATRRGGYLHVGRSAYDDRVSLTLRHLRIG